MTAAAPATEIGYHVQGIAAPKGSKNAWVSPKTGKAHVRESASKKLGPWNRAVYYKTKNELIGMDWDANGPMAVRLQFFMKRPDFHFGSRNKEPYLRADAPRRHTTYPDLDKLVRSTLDAAKKAGLLADDSLVVSLTATKDFAVPGIEPGCTVSVERLT